MDLEPLGPVRPARAEDWAALRELLDDEGAPSAEGRRSYVAAQDPGAGLAIWTEASGGQGVLSLVVTRSSRSGQPRRLFYELSLACARDALSRGCLRGRFVLRDERVVKMIARDFVVEAVVTGYDGDTGEPDEWEVEVDVPDAVRQLERFLSRG